MKWRSMAGSPLLRGWFTLTTESYEAHGRNTSHRSVILASSNKSKKYGEP